MSIKLKDCYSYIVEEEKPKYCFDLFFKYVFSGYSGLLITRANPKKIKEKYESSAEILWLTDRKSKTQKTIPPVLESIIYTLSEFLENNEKCILMIDGIEYLISNNEFNPVLSFIRQIVDEISERNAILLLPACPLAFKAQELTMLERELERITAEGIEKDEKKATKEKIETAKTDEKIIEDKSFPKIKCPYCKGLIDIKTTKRPLTLICSFCKRKFTLIKKDLKADKKVRKKTIKCIYCDSKIQIDSRKKTIKCPSCNRFLIVD